MSDYKTILVAIDINANYESVIKKALSVCQSPDDLSLVYVSFPSTYIQPYMYGIDYSAVNDEERMKHAQAKLDGIAKKSDIPQKHVYLKIGDTADEIKDLADDISADLIVIGTHGRSGLKLLLGSTANAVLHGVKQDVLAVRMHDDG
jgi:universal stress protein A